MIRTRYKIIAKYNIIVPVETDELQDFTTVYRNNEEQISQKDKVAEKKKIMNKHGRNSDRVTSMLIHC